MEAPLHSAAAPPDDGHRGAGTRPDELFVSPESRDPEAGPDNPFLHRNAARRTHARDVVYGMVLAAGLLVVWYLLLGVYVPAYGP
jgi:hypothetical protein